MVEGEGYPSWGLVAFLLPPAFPGLGDQWVKTATSEKDLG